MCAFRYNIPSRKTVTTKLGQKREIAEAKLQKELREVADISITHDGWTSLNTESYGTVTGHYITQDWELKSVVLETKRIEGSHTGENIRDHLLDTQSKWKLPAKPIAVTDNAANEKKAFALLDWPRFGCYGHRINLMVKKALALPDLARILGKGRKLVTYFHQSSSTNDLLMVKQKLLLDGSAVGHKLIMDCPTRWNSTHDMLQRLLEQTSAIMAVISDPKLSKNAATVLKNCVFTFDEQAVLEKVVAVLSPFLNATKSVCGDKSPTLHMVIPIILKLKASLSTCPADPPIIVKMKETMSEELEKRTDDKDLPLLACMVNPFMKDLDFVGEEGRALLHTVAGDRSEDLLRVKTEPPELGADTPPLPRMPDDQDESDDITISVSEHKAVPVSESEHKSDTQPAKRVKCVIADMDDWLQDVVVTGESKVPRTDVIRQEISRYLAVSPTEADSSLTALQWWEKYGVFYPHISVLARKYLSVPASSVSSERVFSLAGNLVNKKRARLSSANVDLIIFLNKNMCYW